MGRLMGVEFTDCTLVYNLVIRLPLDEFSMWR